MNLLGTNNLKKACNILTQLLGHNITDFCLCAGGRNAPFVSWLSYLQQEFSKTKTIHIYEFFDERSASFFALGRIKKIKKPVVVLTTSGTAVAETLPAVIESYYSCRPLIILSSDRPKLFRKSGAPQSIEQYDILSSFVEAKWDLEEESFELNKSQLSWRKPLHINICFAEPILPSDIKSSLQDLWLPNKTDQLKHLYSKNYCPERALEQMTSVSKACLKNISDSKSHEIKMMDIACFLIKHKNPLVIVSEISPTLKDAVVHLLLQLNQPVYVEALSGLKQERRLGSLLIQAGEKSIERAFQKKLMNAVIKIGSAPTLKFWRKLEREYSSVPVLCFNTTEFSNLARKSDSYTLEQVCHLTQNCPISSWAQDVQPVEIKKSPNKSLEKTEDSSNDRKKCFFEMDRDFFLKKKRLLKKYPLSEQNFLYVLSRQISSSDLLFLGNSLPIRYWDIFSETYPAQIFSHRGANGIDGLISGFLGVVSASNKGEKAWLILGDLSALYDMNALWALKYCKADYRICIINNQGGKIFSTLFNEKLFEARHNFSFENWVKFFQQEYFCFRTTKNMFCRSNGIYEFKVNLEETEGFLSEY